MAELRLTRTYAAPPAEVWAVLTEPASLGRWLAEPGAVELAPGGALELTFPGGSRMRGRVRALDPPRLLELDWRHEDEPPSVVRFELAPDGEGTKLVLEHRRLEARLGQAYAAGWSRHLERFERELQP